ncbi:recombinase family protein [Gluconacetobacter sacchari]|uniref:Recombinase family protein n=2 Tax=Gluconacetobacter sacchari TaxID=92759 RepID=A0A7W4NQ49_9PROT|nr:recombinase family protein [Gluconacetobacter sacchari]MBB2158760.1 recombinase family protein [Gluconacetobacter sacchari]GBQ24258.1 DNA resolvase [Gluconacetobacter sacchari DSM 12717]
MIIGYARVSSEDQNLAVQIQALQQAGCAMIFKEKLSGASTRRPALQRLLRTAGHDDIIVVMRLDRLARSTRDLLDIVEKLKQNGAGFKSIQEPWADTTSPAGRLILTIFAGIAEFDRALIRDRTAAGRKLARERGVHMGRPRKLSNAQITAIQAMMRNKTADARHVAHTYKIHRSTVYRIVNAARGGADYLEQARPARPAEA